MTDAQFEMCAAPPGLLIGFAFPFLRTSSTSFSSPSIRPWTCMMWCLLSPSSVQASSESSQRTVGVMKLMSSRLVQALTSLKSASASCWLMAGSDLKAVCFHILKNPIVSLKLLLPSLWSRRVCRSRRRST